MQEGDDENARGGVAVAPGYAVAEASGRCLSDPTLSLAVSQRRQAPGVIVRGSCLCHVSRDCAMYDALMRCMKAVPVLTECAFALLSLCGYVCGSDVRRLHRAHLRTLLRLTRAAGDTSGVAQVCYL